MPTLGEGTTKQSPSPQHHSPAALRCPPRWIQLSWAEAGEMRRRTASCERISETSSDRAKHRNMTTPCVVPARRKISGSTQLPRFTVCLFATHVAYSVRQSDDRPHPFLRDAARDSAQRAHTIGGSATCQRGSANAESG